MFRSFRKSQPAHPTPALAQALANNGLPPGMDPASLCVLEQRGTYSGRQVKYFRVFDPVRVAECAVDIRAFTELDNHPELVVGSGHIERNGAIVLSQEHRPPSLVSFSRTRADRSEHADDEQYVFPDRTS
jgi:hypothetical protein